MVDVPHGAASEQYCPIVSWAREAHRDSTADKPTEVPRRDTVRGVEGSSSCSSLTQHS